MIDLHAHVLPGVDDGPATIAESLGLLRAAGADGVTRVAATPHVRDDYPTPVETMERLVAELGAAAREAGIAVEVLRGGELDLERLSQLDDDALRRFGLGGNPRLLLLETPYLGWPLGLGEIVFRLAARGFTAILAHPERNPEVQARPELLRPLVEAGLLVQLTGGSLAGGFGRSAQACAAALLEARCAHLLASDAHALPGREGGLAAGAAALGDAPLARWLTDDVPAALLAGEPLPPRPEPRRTGRLAASWRT